MKEYKKQEEMIYFLTEISLLALIYGVPYIVKEANTYSEDLKRSVIDRDKSLTASIMKLSERFLHYSAKILLFYVARDIRESTLKDESVSVADEIEAVQFLVSFL